MQPIRIAALPRTFAVVAGVLLASGCGGGSGGGGSPAPVPTITISSPAAATVRENSTGTVLTVSASASNGAKVSYAVVGGADADKFAISSSGELTFKSAPNYDLYADADSNNVYQVKLRASAGGGSADQDIAVTLTNDREGISVKRIVTGLGTNPVMTPYSHASTNGILVAQQSGQMWLIDPATGAKTDFGQIFATGESGRVLALSFFNLGVIAMIDDPTKGVYLQLVPPPGGSTLNRRQILLAPSASLNPTGALFVGQDGYLYAALGDPGGHLAQDASSDYGKLLSVVLDPYCGASIYSFCFTADVVGKGVRDPGGGGGIYPGTTTFLFDQAATGEEEVTGFDVTKKPLDFGWPSWAGTVALVQDPPAVVTGPSIVYDHGSGLRDGQGVIGGAIYPGQNASLKGMLVFADVTGKIWAAKSSFLSDGAVHKAPEVEIRTEDFTPDHGSIDHPVGIVTDPGSRMVILDSDGELFLVDAG